MATKPTALGGNIFAGLFTRGVADAGFKILGHLEHGDYGVETAKRNFPGLDVRYGVENWKIDDFLGKVNFMYCNPPCAPWSNAAGRVHDNWKTDDRTKCVTDLVHAGRMIKPDAWAWESVVPAWTKGRDFVIDQALKWESDGYSVTILLQNNMYLGAPQNRKRMFVIAHRYTLVWPAFVMNPPTVADILATVDNPPEEVEHEKLDGFYAELWRRSLDFHGSLADAADAMTLEDRKSVPYYHHPSFLSGRLDPNKVCPVLMSNDKMTHPYEPRNLTLTEMRALCGLPKSWKVNPKYSEAGAEMARAVLPAVGKWLGTAVRDGLKLNRLPNKTIKMVDFRKPGHIVMEELQ
jgi:site-specific DNA-cytosine methylase